MIGSVVKGVKQLAAKTLNEVLNEDEQLKMINVREKLESGAKKIVVFVIGGISLGEIASLKLLSQKLGRQIIIGSTHIIRKNCNMINQFIKSVEQDMEIFHL